MSQEIVLIVRLEGEEITEDDGMRGVTKVGFFNMESRE